MTAQPRGARPGMASPAEPAPRSMVLVVFKELRRNSLRGFATITLPNGLTIADCPINIGSNGRAWAALPARPVIGADGRQVVTRHWQKAVRQHPAVAEPRDRRSVVRARRRAGARARPGRI
jgi:hypothetical protein